MSIWRTDRITAIEKRLAEMQGDLERGLSEAKGGPADVQDLRLEFEELKDKVLRWMQRANARKRSDPELVDEPPQRPSTSSYLDHMDPHSRRIHERRLRGRTTLHVQPGVGVVAVNEEE